MEKNKGPTVQDNVHWMYMYMVLMSANQPKKAVHHLPDFLCTPIFMYVYLVVLVEKICKELVPCLTQLHAAARLKTEPTHISKY